VADSCRTGAATDIIFGLALGYKSAIIPCLVIALAIFISFTLASVSALPTSLGGRLPVMLVAGGRLWDV
jgi:inorganic pyrophosphatase